MLFALDEAGNKVHIDSAKRSQEYFCPCCGSKLMLKMGDIRTHHFAHCGNGVCQDSWHYDMSEWHYCWQNEFPIELREVVKENNNGQKHRADVLIEEAHVVIEFQHSNLSPEEFKDRNTFYNNLGYTVIWVFDAEKQYRNGQIENYSGNKWKWKWSPKTFEYFDCKNKHVEVYLQLGEDDLVRATWCTKDDGFSFFATDGHAYDEDSIINICHDKAEIAESEVKLDELYDKLIALHTEDHTRYFFGCPISNTHICGNNHMEIPESQYRETMPCTVCEFRCDDDYMACKKRFLDLNLDPNTIVRIEGRDKYKFINRISYVNDGKREYLELPTFEQNIGKSVFELWEEAYSVAIFKNLRTRNYIRITKNPKEQYNKYHKKVYGSLSPNQYQFSNRTFELFDVEKPEWVCVWFR